MTSKKRYEIYLDDNLYLDHSNKKDAGRMYHAVLNIYPDKLVELVEVDEIRTLTRTNE
jgi:hypothetical protein